MGIDSTGQHRNKSSTRSGLDAYKIETALHSWQKESNSIYRLWIQTKMASDNLPFLPSWITLWWICFHFSRLSWKHPHETRSLMPAGYPITNAPTMIISETSEVTFCKRIHSKWRQIISNIKKDGSVSYVTIQLRVKEDKAMVHEDVPSLLGASVELEYLRRLRHARGSDDEPVRQQQEVCR